MPIEMLNFILLNLSLCLSQVLRDLRHIDTNNAIQLKGRVACEINNHELVITELVFQNILSPLPTAEIAALLSCMVFQEKRCSEPELTESLKEVSVRSI